MKRWECPNGLHPGVLAPSRMHAEDTRRFCIACTAEAPRLVRRTAPALVKARATKAEGRKLAAKKTKAQQAARLLDFWTVGGLDVREVAAKCWKALGQGERPLPEIGLRRRSHAYSTGHAYGHRITTTFGHGIGGDAAAVWELTLHELTHCAVGCHHWHDETFNRALSKASIELFDLGLPIERGYGPSRFLETRLRARFTAAAQPQEGAHAPDHAIQPGPSP